MDVTRRALKRQEDAAADAAAQAEFNEKKYVDPLTYMCNSMSSS